MPVVNIPMGDWHPTYVYMLSDYEENGAQHVTATLDRTRLHAMIAENWAPLSSHGHYHIWIAEAQAALAVLLARADEDLAAKDGISLHQGWGGIQLHVVKLV